MWILWIALADPYGATERSFAERTGEDTAAFVRQQQARVQHFEAEEKDAGFPGSRGRWQSVPASFLQDAAHTTLQEDDADVAGMHALQQRLKRELGAIQDSKDGLGTSFAETDARVETSEGADEKALQADLLTDAQYSEDMGRMGAFRARLSKELEGMTSQKAIPAIPASFAQTDDDEVLQSLKDLHAKIGRRLERVESRIRAANARKQQEAEADTTLDKLRSDQGKVFKMLVAADPLKRGQPEPRESFLETGRGRHLVPDYNDGDLTQDFIEGQQRPGGPDGLGVEDDEGAEMSRILANDPEAEKYEPADRAIADLQADAATPYGDGSDGSSLGHADPDDGDGDDVDKADDASLAQTRARASLVELHGTSHHVPTDEELQEGEADAVKAAEDLRGLQASVGGDVARLEEAQSKWRREASARELPQLKVDALESLRKE